MDNEHGPFGSPQESGLSGIGAQRPSADAAGMLNAMDLPVVVVDRDCTVIYFNDAAAGTLPLSPSDIGEHLRGLAEAADARALEMLCGQVMSDHTALRQELRCRHRQFLLRVAPYGSDGGVAGAVLAFSPVAAHRPSRCSARFAPCSAAISRRSAACCGVARTPTRWSRGFAGPSRPASLTPSRSRWRGGPTVTKANTWNGESSASPCPMAMAWCATSATSRSRSWRKRPSTTPIAARTSSWRCWLTNYATRWRRFGPASS